MIQICYYCHQIYGEKEPLTNREETNGECELCHWLFTLWYSLWREGMTEETATQFILDCRKLFIVIQDAVAEPGLAEKGEPWFSGAK